MILIDRIVTLRSRSPCGERGLKSFCTMPVSAEIWSLPVRGAWIEIGLWLYSISVLESLPVRGAWIEMR